MVVVVVVTVYNNIRSMAMYVFTVEIKGPHGG